MNKMTIALLILWTIHSSILPAHDAPPEVTHDSTTRINPIQPERSFLLQQRESHQSNDNPQQEDVSTQRTRDTQDRDSDTSPELLKPLNKSEQPAHPQKEVQEKFNALHNKFEDLINSDPHLKSAFDKTMGSDTTIQLKNLMKIKKNDPKFEEKVRNIIEKLKVPSEVELTNNEYKAIAAHHQKISDFLKTLKEISEKKSTSQETTTTPINNMADLDKFIDNLKNFDPKSIQSDESFFDFVGRIFATGVLSIFGAVLGALSGATLGGIFASSAGLTVAGVGIGAFIGIGVGISKSIDIINDLSQQAKDKSSVTIQLNDPQKITKRNKVSLFEKLQSNFGRTARKHVFREYL